MNLIGNRNNSSAYHSHQQQFTKTQPLKYLQRQRSIDQDPNKIKGLTRESAITQYLLHKKMASQNMDISGIQLEPTSHGHSMEQPKQTETEQEESNDRTKKTEIKMVDDKSVEIEETSGNTRGTIQNELNQFYGMNSYSMHECEPAPASTINDNTATFRCKENSHFNAYDVTDAEFNSVNYRHPSKESQQTRNQFIQSVESFSNQNNNSQVQKQNVIIGNANVTTNAQNMQRQRQQHLNAKQKQISLQNIFDQQAMIQDQRDTLLQTHRNPMNTALQLSHLHQIQQQNCANFQNLKNAECRDSMIDNQQTSVFTEQADIISPEEFDEFVPIDQDENMTHHIQQSTPALENFSDSTPGGKNMFQQEMVAPSFLAQEVTKDQQMALQMSDISQTANIITDHEEEINIQQQMIRNPMTSNHFAQLMNYVNGSGGDLKLQSDRNLRKAQFNSHLSAFCQMQLSTREKQLAWQNLQVEGMSFSQPEEDQSRQRTLRQQEIQMDIIQRQAQNYRQQQRENRENRVINHMLCDYEQKPKQLATNPENNCLDKPSYNSGPSFTQFDALTPISINNTEMQNLNSQRPQSTTKTNKLYLDELHEQSSQLKKAFEGQIEHSNLQQSNSITLTQSMPPQSNNMNQLQFHELQASPHIQTRETDRPTAQHSSRQPVGAVSRPVNSDTQPHSIDTHLATDSKPTIDPDASQNGLNQQNILKNIFFSKDSLQNPQIIRQNENIRISHNCVRFKSILSSFVDDQNQDGQLVKKDLRDINLNLVQVTDKNQLKSKYLMQLTISDFNGNLESNTLTEREPKKLSDSQEVNFNLSHASKKFQTAEVLQDQLQKLDPDPNFDQAYNQVNELMINNLIDDQQITNQRKSKHEQIDHKHYLLLGGGECFQDAQSSCHQVSQQNGHQMLDIGNEISKDHDMMNIQEEDNQINNSIYLQNTAHMDPQKDRQKIQRVASALKCSDNLKSNEQQLTVFQRLNRPKSSQLRESKYNNQKSMGGQTCKKNIGKADQLLTVGTCKSGQLVRPATQLIQDLYYDHFTRNKKKEKQQQDSQENRQKILIQKSQENLHKQNMILAKRIIDRVQKSFYKHCGSNKKHDCDNIDINTYLKILQELYYIDMQKKDQLLFSLALEMWKIISRIKINRHQYSHGSEISLISKVNNSIESNDHTRYTSLNDLQIYILAIENVHFLKGLQGEKTPLNLDKWILEKYNMYEPLLVKKISIQFKRMVQHRQKRLTQIVQEKELQQFKNINRFEPKINRKSELIVNMKPDRIELSQRGISARNSNSRANSRDKTQSGDLAGATFRSQRTFSGSRKTIVQRINNQSMSRSRRGHFSKMQGQNKKSDEQLMIQGQTLQFGNAAVLSEEGAGNYTCFSPKLNNQASKSNLTNRYNDSQIQNSNRSGNLKRARSFEANQRLTGGVVNQVDSSNTTRRSMNQNVFFNLYKIAKERQEKSADSHRQALEQMAKKEAEECTFKPDFSKTQQVTKKYLERRGVTQLNDQKTAEHSKGSNPISKRSHQLQNGKIISHALHQKQKSDGHHNMNMNQVLVNKKSNGLTVRRKSNSKQQLSNRSQKQNWKKKKSKKRNNKLLQFTTQFEKENTDQNQMKNVLLTDNVHSHLRSFVTDNNDEPIDRTQLMGSRLITHKLNLSDFNCVSSPENQGKTNKSVQHQRIERAFQKGYMHIDLQKIQSKLDQSLFGPKTNKANVGSSHQNLSSLTQSIQFNNLDEIIATDDMDETYDCAQQTAPAQIEMTLQISPDSNKKLSGPEQDVTSQTKKISADSTSNSLEVVMDVRLNDQNNNLKRK